MFTVNSVLHLQGQTVHSTGITDRVILYPPPKPARSFHVGRTYISVSHSPYSRIFLGGGWGIHWTTTTHFATRMRMGDERRKAFQERSCCPFPSESIRTVISKLWTPKERRNKQWKQRRLALGPGPETQDPGFGICLGSSDQQFQTLRCLLFGCRHAYGYRYIPQEIHLNHMRPHPIHSDWGHQTLPLYLRLLDVGDLAAQNVRLRWTQRTHPQREAVCCISAQFAAVTLPSSNQLLMIASMHSMWLGVTGWSNVQKQRNYLLLSEEVHPPQQHMWKSQCGVVVSVLN